ncbi:hypothetical protein B0H17DRAFT_1190294 [Mycena rosella]|uniref:C2H2-type domain-containing protein n=1 Tax=Mycena rosella TaxID=1033263 RepID=A0AAD7H2S1_MYCRO|nr:hypothetical protein B0H17DRAFT_1190294 [Mycena rosella]
MSLTWAPTGTWEDKPTAAFILETTKASFLPLSPLPDIQFESRSHATHVPDNSFHQMAYPSAALPYPASYHRVSHADYPGQESFSAEMGTRSTPNSSYHDPGAWAPLQPSYERSATADVEGDQRATFIDGTVPGAKQIPWAEYLAEYVDLTIYPAVFNSLLLSAADHLPPPSPPSPAASLNAGVAPSDLQLIPSTHHAVPAQRPAYAPTTVHYPSVPKYTQQSSGIHRTRPMPQPISIHGMYPYPPHMYAAPQYSPSESTSGSPSPVATPNLMPYYRAALQYPSRESSSGFLSPVATLDPMRHYPQPLVYPDSAPVSRLTSPEVAYRSMPPVAGPSKSYGQAQEIIEEKKAKRKHKREMQRHNPMPVYVVASDDPVTPRARTFPCTDAGNCAGERITMLVTASRKMQYADRPNFECRWNGCGKTISTRDVMEHLKNVHGSEWGNDVQCMWYECDEPVGTRCKATMEKGGIKKHVCSSRHLELKWPCPTCPGDFARSDVLGKHLKLKT